MTRKGLTESSYHWPPRVSGSNTQLTRHFKESIALFPLFLNVGRAWFQISMRISGGSRTKSEKVVRGSLSVKSSILLVISSRQSGTQTKECFTVFAVEKTTFGSWGRSCLVTTAWLPGCRNESFSDPDNGSAERWRVKSVFDQNAEVCSNELSTADLHFISSTDLFFADIQSRRPSFGGWSKSPGASLRLTEGLSG